MFGYRKADPDLEAGGSSLLYPGMTESPELRWAFVRKIYVILAVQLAMTAAVSAFVVKVPAVSNFFVSSNAGVALYIFLIILPFLVLCPLRYYHQKHPVNLLLLGLFTVAISFAVGMTCAFTSGVSISVICSSNKETFGKIILEAAILTAVVVISLTAYTFWAAKRGHDFNFLGPFLFAAIMVLMVFSLIQIFFPLGKISVMIYGGLASLIFCGYIIYDTDNVIKRYTYDEYIWAAVSLYLDVINLFLSLLQLLRAADS
ncbi:Bax inhibitor-1 family protein [Zea mays]|uniref:Bax inhibitor-1 family protein n=1 Tax=Zea mays TaxID=4577 RepID=A0A1D6L7L2_MAIZE|nr:Bax inhibitor-1 family protein [Zea mays]